MTILRKLLLHNFGIKLLSLLSALILWTIVQGESDVEGFLQVDVQLNHRPSHLLITNKVADHITLGLRGSKAQIAKLNKNASVAPYQVNLQNAEAGSALFRVFSVDFKLPQGVQITRIAPQLITVDLERQRSRVLPVRVSFQGGLESGFSVAKTTVEPATVTVLGAESDIMPLKEVTTEALSLDGVRGELQQELRLVLREGANLWFKEEQVAKVHVKIREHLISALVEEVPIEAMAANRFKQVILDPPLGSLAIHGPAGLVNHLLSNKPRLFVQTDKIQLAKDGKRALRMKLRHALPKGVRHLQTTPPTILVTLQR